MRFLMYKTIAITTLLVLNVLSPAMAAGDENNVKEMSTRERIFVGGFVGLQFGTFTAVNVSAQAGYRITNRFSAGVGSSYQYERSSWFGTSFSSHVYGGSVFARYRVVARAFIHAENEWLSFQSRLPGMEPGERPRITETNTLLGIGYGLPLSDRVRLNILLLYNLNDNSQVYYDNPFFRVGVDVGL
jgi:hypothetical protein